MSSTCPICGQVVTEKSGAFEMKYKEDTIFCCSMECLRLFQAFPDAYAGGGEDEVETVDDLEVM